MKNDDLRKNSGALDEFTGESDPTGESNALWKLLGEAKPVEVSPFFARNVLREIRVTSQPLSFWQRLRAINRRWIPAAAMMALLIGVTCNQLDTGHQGKAGQQTAPRKDYEVISNLDTLLAAQESSVWLDDSEQ